jgi:myo-inositol 2-dehydrogenase/D-chiro-inositol 1-dehydrogenase
VVLGERGKEFTIKDRKGNIVWKLDTKKTPPGRRMYVAEHEALYASIRSGQPINNGLYMARSTMLAILGRMADYTGQKITWEQAMNSKESLAPSAYQWSAAPPILPGPDGTYPIALPGVTKFV